MVDSNLQREHLKPSEKAFAYKMKLEAMKRQGARTDLTSSQVGKKLSSSQNVTETSDQVGKKLTSSQVVTGTSDQAPPKLDNLTAKVYSLKSEHDANGNWKVGQGNVIATGVRADELLAKQVGENRMTIQRYIRLTNLIPKLLDMVDEGKIAFTIAVELSYLTEEEQYELYEVMNMEQCTPSLSQANRMKRMSQSGELDMDGMFLILEQEKPNQREQIKLRADTLAKYFPEDYTPKQKTDLIERLVKEWYEKQKLEKTQSQGNSRGRAR
jgi:ParB family chromosome partitioning protein